MKIAAYEDDIGGGFDHNLNIEGCLGKTLDQEGG